MIWVALLTDDQLSLQIYLVDAFAELAASALAATTVARSLGGALIPLAGPILYQRLGLGWGNSLVALANLAMGVVPCLLFIRGKAWREKALARSMLTPSDPDTHNSPAQHRCPKR